MKLITIKADYNRSISINNLLYGMMTDKVFKTIISPDIYLGLVRVKVQ